MLKPVLTALTLTLALAAPGVHAENTQQNRMADCNKQADGKKGDERKAFMKACLSGKPAEAATPFQGGGCRCIHRPRQVARQLTRGCCVACFSYFGRSRLGGPSAGSRGPMDGQCEETP